MNEQDDLFKQQRAPERTKGQGSKASFGLVPTISRDAQFFIAACMPDCMPLLHQADAEENESHGHLSAEGRMSRILSITCTSSAAVCMQIATHLRRFRTRMALGRTEEKTVKRVFGQSWKNLISIGSCDCKN